MHPWEPLGCLQTLFSSILDHTESGERTKDNDIDRYIHVRSVYYMYDEGTPRRNIDLRRANPGGAVETLTLLVLSDTIARLTELGGSLPMSVLVMWRLSIFLYSEVRAMCTTPCPCKRVYWFS